MRGFFIRELRVTKSRNSKIIFWHSATSDRSNFRTLEFFFFFFRNFSEDKILRCRRVHTLSCHNSWNNYAIVFFKFLNSVIVDCQISVSNFLRFFVCTVVQCRGCVNFHVRFSQEFSIVELQNFGNCFWLNVNKITVRNFFFSKRQCTYNFDLLKPLNLRWFFSSINN